MNYREQGVTFIPNAPTEMEIGERIAWRHGYRAALELLSGSEDDIPFQWCEAHQSTSPQADRCDYARWKNYDDARNDCKLVPCAVVTGAREV